MGLTAADLHGVIPAIVTPFTEDGERLDEAALRAITRYVLDGGVHAIMTTGGTGGLVPFLEAALIADGVEKDAVYPIDIERAYNSLSKIKGDVVKWWEAGAQPAQALTDNEAVMVHAWNGRIAAIQAEGAPAGITWNEGMLATDVWAIPKGAKNAENAQKFTAFITMAIPQARLSMLIPYGFVNEKAAEYIPAERLAQLPTAPQYKDQMFERNAEWWVENRDAVLERWNEWILE